MENTYQEEVATQPVPQSSSDIIETGQAVDALIHQVTNPQLTTDVIIDPEHVQETGSEVIIQETEHHGNADTNLQLVCLEEQAQTEEEMTVVEIPSQVTSGQLVYYGRELLILRKKLIIAASLYMLFNIGI